MSELLWVKVPPPRVAKEAMLTSAVAVAIASYAIPVVTATDPEAALPVELADVPDFCCFCGHEEPEEPEADAVDDITPPVDRPLTRAQAIEEARVGGLGAIDALRPAPSWSIEDRELAGHGRPFATLVQPQRQPTQPTFSVFAQGALERGVVRRYLTRQRHVLARCYDPSPSLRLGRPARGDLDPAVQFLIDRDGRVVHVIPYRSPELAACLSQTIQTLAFPRSAGLTQVHVPVHYGTMEASAAGFVR